MTYRYAFAVLVSMATACGGTEQSGSGGGAAGIGGQTGGAAGAGGATSAGGAAGAGGATSAGGAAGAGGATSAGGAAGAGGSPLVDSGPIVVCADDAGTHLASVARVCTGDSDCTVLYGQTCCSQSAYGIAKSAVATYGGCFFTDVSKCMTGCASPNWYRTDTGAMTPMVAYGIDAKQYVAVHCAVGLCTTDALPRDAGAEAQAVQDAGCNVGCTRMGQGTAYCASPAVEWVCSAQHDRARMLSVGCVGLATGSIRYCCPDVLSQCP
jgi:hypothetical protein